MSSRSQVLILWKSVWTSAQLKPERKQSIASYWVKGNLSQNRHNLSIPPSLQVLAALGTTRNSVILWKMSITCYIFFFMSQDFILIIFGEPVSSWRATPSHQPLGIRLTISGARRRCHRSTAVIQLTPVICLRATSRMRGVKTKSFFGHHESPWITMNQHKSP